MYKTLSIALLVLASTLLAADAPKKSAPAKPATPVKAAPAKPATAKPKAPAKVVSAKPAKAVPAKPAAPKAPAVKPAVKPAAPAKPIVTATTETPREKLIRLARADYLSLLFREVTNQTLPAMVEIRVEKQIALTPANIKKYFGGKTPPPQVASPTAPKKPTTPGKTRTYRVKALGSGSIFDAQRGLIITSLTA